MSEEELNQELSTDELKDVTGGVSGQVVNKSGVAGNPAEPEQEGFSPNVVGRVKEKKKGNSSSWAEGDWDGNR